jgi:hypothetical protein
MLDVPHVRLRLANALYIELLCFAIQELFPTFCGFSKNNKSCRERGEAILDFSPLLVEPFITSE